MGTGAPWSPHNREGATAMTFRKIASTAVLCLALPFAASAQTTGQTGVTTGQTGPAAAPVAPPAAQQGQPSVTVVAPLSGTVGLGGGGPPVPGSCAEDSVSRDCKRGLAPRGPGDDLQSINSQTH
jgi:hypothetical protein